MTGVQCPYTASNCPLFNPIFSEADVLAARSPRPSSPQLRPRFQTNQLTLDSATTSRSTFKSTADPTVDRDQVTLPSLSLATLNRTPILDTSLPHTNVSYTDYSLAPSNEDTTSLPFKYFSPPPSTSLPSNRNTSPLTLLNSTNSDNRPRAPSFTSSSSSFGKNVPSESSCAAAHQAHQRRQVEQQHRNGAGIPQRHSSSSYSERDMEDLLGIYSMDFPGSFSGTGLSGVQPRELRYGSSGMSNSPPESCNGGSGASNGDGERGEVLESRDRNGGCGFSGREGGEATLTELSGRRSSASGSGDEVGGKCANGAAGHHGGGTNGAAQEVTPFISKLSHLLSHNEYAEFIRWNTEGNAFIFAHTSPALLEIFARFFRHANVHSFVRQLNIYGFTRLSTLALLTAIDSSSPYTRPSTTHTQDHTTSTPDLSASDFSGFSHPTFFRDASPGEVGGRKCELEKIKPKVTTRKVNTGAGGRGRARKRKSGAVLEDEEADEQLGLGLRLDLTVEGGRVDPPVAQRRRTGA